MGAQVPQACNHAALTTAAPPHPSHPPLGGGPAGAAEADPHHLAFCAAVVASLPYKRGDEPCLVVQVRRLADRPSPLLRKPHHMLRLAPWQDLAAPCCICRLAIGFSATLYSRHPCRRSMRWSVAWARGCERS